MLKDKFISYIQVEKRYASHTLTSYEADIQAFAVFIQEYKHLDLYNPDQLSAISHRDLRRWMSDLSGQGLQGRSIARKLASVKSYFAFLVREDILPQSPATKVRRPAFSSKLPVFLKESETERLFDPATFTLSFEGIRDMCILELFYGCGVRSMELIQIQHKDIDLYNHTLQVLGKGNKVRIIPFGKQVSQSLAKYLEIKLHAGLSCAEGFLFTRPKGEKLYPRLVYRIVKTYLTQHSNVSRQSPHVLRHTFATHMLDNGADLNAIKELLGHSSLAATQVYTHNTIQKLKSAYKLAHPKA